MADHHALLDGKMLVLKKVQVVEECGKLVEIEKELVTVMNGDMKVDLVDKVEKVVLAVEEELADKVVLADQVEEVDMGEEEEEVVLVEKEELAEKEKDI